MQNAYTDNALSITQRAMERAVKTFVVNDSDLSKTTTEDDSDRGGNGESRGGEGEGEGEGEGTVGGADTFGTSS